VCAPTSLTPGDLTGADLTDADITDAILRRATLAGADLTGADLTDEPVSSEDLIQAGAVPPFIQSGMIVRHRDGGPALRVEHIEDLTNPTAACRSGVGKAVRVPCAEMRADYRLVESFKP
jgi:hypothetical protein